VQEDEDRKRRLHDESSLRGGPGRERRNWDGEPGPSVERLF
jgi:hypothetical protein